MMRSGNQLKNSRYVAFDVTRGICVLLALLSHLLTHVSYFEGTDQTRIIIKFASRTAMPSLLVLFGVMLQIVYFPKYVTDAGKCANKLLMRSYVCYTAFIFLAVENYLAGSLGFSRLVGAFGMISYVYCSNIFKFYTILLILSPFLLKLRLLYSKTGIYTFTVLLWLAACLICEFHPSPLRSPFQHAGGLLVGVGQTFGPSVFHSLVFVTFGMTAGRLLKKDFNTWDLIWIIGMLALAIVLLIIDIYHIGLQNFVENIVDIYEYRFSNKPQYFAFGIIGATVIYLISNILALHSMARGPRVCGENLLDRVFSLGECNHNFLTNR